MLSSPRETVSFKELVRVLQQWIERQAESLDEAGRVKLHAQLTARLSAIDTQLLNGSSLVAEELLRSLLIEHRLIVTTRSATPSDSPNGFRGEPMGRGRDLPEEIPEPKRMHHDSRTRDRVEPEPMDTGRDVPMEGRLSALLARLRPREKASPLVTFPSVTMPTAVRQKTMLMIEVAAHAQPSADSVQQLALAREHKDEPVDVELSVELPADSGLQARGPLSAVLRICPDGRAAKIVFELYASEVGDFPLAVVFRYDGVERIRANRHIRVTEIEQASEQPSSQVSLSLGIDASRHFDGLLLRLCERDRSSSERHFDVILSGRAWGGRPLCDRMSLPADASALVAKLCRDMERSLRSAGSWSAREFSMQGIGADLASRMLPQSILDALLQARWQEGTPLHIESDDAWIPWEAMFLGAQRDARGGQTGFFLGEHFAVTRWLRIGSAKEQVGGASAVMVAPTNSGLSVGKERAVLAEVTGQMPVELSSLSDVQQCLRGQPSAQLLHFACHGQSSADSVITETLILEGGELHATDVPLASPGQEGTLEGALVFLNACQSGIEQLGLLRHSGWASKLLEAGVGAVVAPSWTVTDSGAMGFAEHFYRGAKAGMSLAEAARQARRAIAHTGNLDRTGYALYAAPTAQANFAAQPG